MKYFAVLIMFTSLIYAAVAQTAKPKKTDASKSKPASSKSSSAKAKPTPAKSGSTAKASKPKTTSTVSKATSGKARTTTAKTIGISKSARSTTSTLPKSAVDDKAEYEAAAAIDDPAKRIEQLRKFIAQRPTSKLIPSARELLVKTEADAGFERLQAGDLSAATALFRSATADCPPRIPDQLFKDSLTKMPAALFWRGEREAGVELAAELAAKTEITPEQRLSLADFYLGIESGAAAKQLAEAVIATDPNMPAAYQALGLAERIDFRLDEAAAAYAKALELDPEFVTSRRGLAEMKRALGKPDEAVELYRQILAKDETSIPAETGLILSLFEDGKRAEAESAMNRSLESNPGNVMLLAGAAYWYAAHGEGSNAILFAQRAIAADPRFIWSHIALARGYMAEKQPLDAERVLLAARRYGNFPTLEYEIASARAMAGYFREAAEELTKSFLVSDGVVRTKLGGRIVSESKDFTDLISLERRASISAPVAADTPENAAELRELLSFWQKINNRDTPPEALSKAADAFVGGDDKMKFHREIFAAKEMLERKEDLPKVLELSRGLIGQAEAALDVPSPSAAVMADELYDTRRLAVTRGEYIRAPDVPSATLLNILRGRIEDLNGRALFETDNAAEAVVRLKRAVSILPRGSSWWKTSSWRLGAAYEADGKGADALDAYIGSYKIGQPDAINYSVIASLYRRLNGSLEGLEAKIGPNPAVAANGQPPTVRSLGEVPIVRTFPDPTPEATPGSTPIAAATPEPTPMSTPESSPTPALMTTKDPEVKPVSAATPEPTTEVSPVPSPQPFPSPRVDVPSAEEAARSLPTPTPTPTSIATPTPLPGEPVADVEPRPSPTPAEATASDTAKQPTTSLQDPTKDKIPEQTAKTVPDEKTVAAAEMNDTKPVSRTTEKASGSARTTLDSGANGLFPPVVISIPQQPSNKVSQDRQPVTTVPANKQADAEPAPETADIRRERTEPETAKPDTEPSRADPLISRPEPETKIPDTKSADEKPEDDDEPAPVVTAASKKRPADPTGTEVSRPRIVQERSDTLSPCKLILSEASLTLQNGVGELAVIVGTEDDRDISAITAMSSDQKMIEVHREPIAGIKGRALYVVRSIGSQSGSYSILFALPCGQKELAVKVR